MAEGAPTTTSATVALAEPAPDPMPFATGELRVVQVPEGPHGPNGQPDGDARHGRPIPLMFIVLGAALLLVLVYAAFQSRTGADDATTATTDEVSSALIDGISAAGESTVGESGDSGTGADGEPDDAATAGEDETATTVQAEATPPDAGGDPADDATASTSLNGSTQTTAAPSTVATTVAPTTVAPSTTAPPSPTTAGPTTTRAGIGQPLQLRVPSLPDVEQGEQVDLFVVAVGGESGPVTFSAANLPTGLSIDANTGRITGTATEEGVFSATVTVSQGDAEFSQGFGWEIDG